MHKYVPVLALTALALLVGCAPSDDSWKERRPRGMDLETEGLLLRPESERFLDFFIIGLSPYKHFFYNLPDLSRNPGAPEAVFRSLQREAYWMDFELTHGAIMRLLPSNTHLFVAVPEGFGEGPPGIEKESFVQYLLQRNGWTQDELRKRVHFFRAAQPLIWLQDVGEILGRDAEGHAVIRIDGLGRDEYKGNVRALVRAYPEFFSLKETTVGVRAEGGDEELVWLPGGGMGLMAGRNRASQYLEAKGENELAEKGLNPQALEEMRRAFSDAFYKLPVFFIPEKPLFDPSLGSKELFHMDMVAAILKNDLGHHAFVPTYGPGAGDSTSFEALDPALVKACQEEYDLVARQLKSMGYKTVRLPFADHPVRGPVNVVKFFDISTKRYTVFLGRYPYHLPVTDEHTPARLLREALHEQARVVADWVQAPGPERLAAVKSMISKVWMQMEMSVQAPNPDFEAQAQAFRKEGYDVVSIPLYAGGAGGLHCLALR